MFTVKMKFVKPVLFIFPAITGLLLWNYANDLHTRFPDIDLSRSRLGIASWYSETDRNIHERTASGEKFDDQEITCASWDYPFGEKLLVINTLNGKWVVCRVNDRGPNRRLRRQIDLTKAAFKRISSPSRGLICVAVIPTVKKSGKTIQ